MSAACHLIDVVFDKFIIKFTSVLPFAIYHSNDKYCYELHDCNARNEKPNCADNFCENRNYR